MRVLAIGDVHGCCTALQTLTSAIELTSDDTLIMLGDYVDRGPDSKGVIDHLLELRETVRLVTLRGNHEIMMLETRRARENGLFWLRFGGDTTLDSYSAETIDDIPQSHWDFLDATVPYFETDTHFFVHANAVPDVPLDQQTEQSLYWEHLVRPWFRKPRHHQSGKIMICGHTSQPSGEILDLGSIVCIDTFAHGGMWLTCLEPATGHYWQANESGQLREGQLGLKSQS
ncbi:MAG: serine/threonine protein phosphatase [Verrucomicrobiae bacterium]|nr:serine/threonine protein phosphatase [Verrucomicrobiae bacterium]